jgi:hypothetical protein
VALSVARVPRRACPQWSGIRANDCDSLRAVAELPFTVTFGGPEVEGGRIPASNLARSLLALDQLARRTNALVNPGMPDVYLEARGARSGSYIIDLALQHAEVIGQGAIALFTSDPVSALANIFEVLLSGRASLLWLIRRTRGQPIQAVGPSPTDPDTFIFRTAEGDEL